MVLKISIDQLLHQMDDKTKADFLSKMDRSNKGTVEDILNFPHYFDKYTPKKGTVNGPQLKNSRVYLSVYHFIQYEGLN